MVMAVMKGLEWNGPRICIIVCSLMIVEWYKVQSKFKHPVLPFVEGGFLEIQFQF